LYSDCADRPFQHQNITVLYALAKMMETIERQIGTCEFLNRSSGILSVHNTKSATGYKILSDEYPSTIPMLFVITVKCTLMRCGSSMLKAGS